MGSKAPSPFGNDADHLLAQDSPDKAQSYLNTRLTPLHLENYVDGAFGTSTCPEAWIDAYNPKTGKVIAQVPRTSKDGVEAAIRAARHAFSSWSKTSRQKRSALLRRISELLEENRETFAVWEAIDQGKTVHRARVEVDRAISNFSYFSTYILHEQTAARMIDSADVLTYEHRSPAGVFALISPWNMPLYLLTWKIAPCIAFGCTAVAKPSEVTSITAFLLASIFHQAGIPPGVINIVFGDGPTTGAALVASPSINGVSFTGGTATGVAIRQATAHQIGKHLSLELGGKNATIIFADAMSDPMDRTRTMSIAASAAFENQGEICLAGSRIYVENSVYDWFVAGLVAHVKEKWVVGQTVGAVVSREHYNKIRGYLQLADTESATFSLGTVPDALTEAAEEGYFIAPTILTNVPLESRILKEEIFGPVATVHRFEAEEDAVKMANDSPYGLSAVVLTKDGARMRRVSEQLEVGMVWVNSWLLRELGTPFGGTKGSGVGREGGEYSRDVFTAVKTVHLPAF